MLKELNRNALRELEVAGDGNYFFTALRHFTTVDQQVARKKIVEELIMLLNIVPSIPGATRLLIWLPSPAMAVGRQMLQT